MLERSILLVGCLVLGALILEFSVRRQIAPFVIFWRGWALALRQLAADPANVLMVFCLIAGGTLAQEYFAAFPPAGAVAVTVAVILWQAVTASALAMCAARFHLGVAAEVFAQDDLPRLKLPLWRLIAPKVALIGAAVWLAGYTVMVFTNVLVLNGPAGMVSILAIGMALFAQVLLAPLMLIRPAIACGAHRPVANALRLALRKMPLILILVVLLALPPALLQYGLGLLQAYTGSGPAGHVLATAVIVVFGVLQVFAYEAVTLIVLREAVRPSVEPDAINAVAL